jgi:hypothetical protein
MIAMSNRLDFVKQLTAISVIALMLIPALVTAVPLSNNSTLYQEDESPWWWEHTIMDLDQDRIHDAIWKAPTSTHYDYLDDDNKISVIVDFDHTPTINDENMLQENLSFDVQFRYWLIDSIAGKVSIHLIPEIVKLPGVVFF